MEYIHYTQTPLGGVLLASDGEALTGLWFEGQKHFAESLGKERAERDLPVFRETETWLAAYFAGEDPGFLPKLRPRGTAFQMRVWDLLLTVPFGKTVTYGELAARLEFEMKLGGAEDISFDLITVTGKKTSLPHGVPSDEKVQAGDFFTCDFGAIYDGYHSDTTRTVAVGFATDEMREIYEIVLKAQLSALEIIRPNVKCSDVDKTARDIIEQNGYGENFGHSTGHGVGLDIHELPFVSAKSDTILQPGMIITDEPGIYLPDKFGVRIEDMVCVTENGYYNFVNLPKELLIL